MQETILAGSDPGTGNTYNKPPRPNFFLKRHAQNIILIKRGCTDNKKTWQIIAVWLLYPADSEISRPSALSNFHLRYCSSFISHAEVIEHHPSLQTEKNRNYDFHPRPFLRPHPHQQTSIQEGSILMETIQRHLPLRLLLRLCVWMVGSTLLGNWW